jgi:hypothetical protein
VQQKEGLHGGEFDNRMDSGNRRLRRRWSIINPLRDLISDLEHALLAAISIFLACV